MPRGDGTGPMGYGTMNGREPMGRGAGIGCRRGFGGFYAGTVMTNEEILTEQQALLQKRLDIVNKQLDRMSGSNR